jgi:serine/threonine protein kinase
MFICHLQVHMDVKSPNVLLGRNNTAKLADVGLAKFLHKDYLSVAKSVGTFAWSVSPSHLPGWRAAGTDVPQSYSNMCRAYWRCLVVDILSCAVQQQAPEVLMGSRCSEKVDIFSLGVVLWELVTGKHTRMQSA